MQSEAYGWSNLAGIFYALVWVVLAGFVCFIAKSNNENESSEEKENEKK